MYFQPYGDEQQLNLNWIINEIIALHKQLDPDYETPSFTQVYPYSNLNRLNLDWVLSELKALKELAPEPTPTIDIQAVAEALVALPFDSNTSYQIYDFISKDGEIWRATEAIPAGGEWDSTKWFKTKLGTDLAVLERWINSINNSLTTEIQTRQDADTALQNAINGLTSANISDDSDAGGATVKASLNNLKGSLNGITPFDTTPTNGSTKGVTSNGVFDFFRNAKILNNGEDLDALYGNGATGLYYIAGNVVNAPFNYCGLLVIGSGSSAGWQLVWQYYGAIAFRDHIGDPAKWREWTYIPQDTYPKIYGEYNSNVNPSNTRLYANITNNVAFITGYFRLASAYTGTSLIIGNISLNRKIACESTEGFFAPAIGQDGSLTRIKIDNRCNIILEKNTPANEWFSFSIAIPLRDKFM